MHPKGHCASLLTVPAEVQAHTQEPSSGEVYESRRLRHCADYSVTEAFVAQSKANNLFIKSACVGTKMVQDGASQISVVFVIPEEAAAFGLLTIVFFVPETKSIAYCMSANRHKDCFGAYSMFTSEGVMEEHSYMITGTFPSVLMAEELIHEMVHRFVRMGAG